MFRSGANGFVPRNCSLPDLKYAIHQVYKHDYYISEQIAPNVRRAIRNIAMNKALDHSDREIEFLMLCAEELPLKEIASRMFVSTKTVENYRDALAKKLNIRSKNGLGIYAIRTGLV